MIELLQYLGWILFAIAMGICISEHVKNKHKSEIDKLMDEYKASQILFNRKHKGEPK